MEIIILNSTIARLFSVSLNTKQISSLLKDKDK